jgi:hypothetical protein
MVPLGRVKVLPVMFIVFPDPTVMLALEIDPPDMVIPERFPPERFVRFVLKGCADNVVSIADVLVSSNRVLAVAVRVVTLAVPTPLKYGS